MPHPHDGTVLQLSYRPPIKCFDPKTHNPISCDYDDINDYSPLAKDENGFTPVKEVQGGPTVDMMAAAEDKKEANKKSNEAAAKK